MGYGGVWLPEVGSRDALAMASLLGSVTRRCTVGTGVVPVFSRNVVALTLAVACAAESCGGRFVLGLGAGHPYTTEAWFGSRHRRPLERLSETVRVLRAILAGERVSHRGEFSVEGFHLGSAPPSVPIYLGALAPSSLRLAGEVADGVILNWLPPEGLERAALMAREAAADVHRVVRVIAYVRVVVVEDRADRPAAQQMLREHTYIYASLPSYAKSLRNAGLSELVDRVHAGDESALDALVRALCLCGTRDEVRAQLEEFAAAGMDEVVVYPLPFGDEPAESVLHTLRSVSPLITARSG